MNFIRQILGKIWQVMAIINDKLFRHGCDFSGWATQEELGFSEKKGNQYQPSTNGLSKILKSFEITSNNAIIDIGCGKGKAMYLMSKCPFSQVSGFDISKELVNIANQNFSHLGLKNCVAEWGDAETFDDYDRYNYFYMFNAVPKEIFIKVMDHISESIRRNPRCAIFIYLNPVYDKYIIEHTDFRLLSLKKSFIPWFEYRCYKTENPDKSG